MANTLDRAKSVWIASVIILILGGYVLLPAKYHFGYIAPVETNQQGSEITYKGIDNVSALKVLETKHTVETKMFGSDPYVTGIDGYTPDTKHFWSFYVNGQMASVGANQYITKSTDTITWKVDAIQ